MSGEFETGFTIIDFKKSTVQNSLNHLKEFLSFLSLRHK
jgi:hypothetical protein